VKVLKSRIHVFRHIIQRLLQQKKITQILYKKTDQAIVRKLLRIEHGIKSRRFTVRDVQRHLDSILNILKKLGYNTNIPIDCNIIVQSGKKCRGGYVERVHGKKIEYIKDRVFTKIIIRRTVRRITHVTKHKNYVHFIKKGGAIIRHIIKINPKLRKLVADQAYSKVKEERKSTR